MPQNLAVFTTAKLLALSAMGGRTGYVWRNCTMWGDFD